MMNYYKYLLILFILIPIFCLCQEDNRSNIYNFKGQLRIDTTLTIGHEQYRTWSNIEENILFHIFRNIEYPEFAKEINATGIVLISFDCDTFEIRNIRLINSSHELLEKATINGINKIKDKLIFEFRNVLKSHHGQKYNYLGTYYLPVEFSLTDLNDKMKRKYTMPIITTKTLNFSRWIE